MINKILRWIREWIDKMIGQNTIKQALKVDIAMSADMATALQQWSRMYQNNAPWLDTYVKSLNLPAAIAGEIARSVTIEMEAEFTGSARATFLAQQFEKVLPRLRDMVEYGSAKGGLMFKPYIKDDEIAVDYVQADQFFPVAFDANGSITACVFVDIRRKGQWYYTRLEYHAFDNETYMVRNEAFRSDTENTLGTSVPLDSVDEWAELEPEATITGIDAPLFAYFRYPLANNIDPTSPLGVSCYARAVDLIEQADRQWSDLLWEFDSGKRALYVDALAFDKDKDGLPILRNKRLYRTLNMSGQVGTDDNFFKEWTPTLREQNILAGLDSILKRIEYTCGLAYGTLSDPNEVDKTATEIRASKQRTYATITDTQKALEDALDQLLYAMDVWATIGNLAPRGGYEAVYSFDDSVVADYDTQFAQDTQALGMGVMSKVEFRMKAYGESEEVARERIAWVEAERPKDFFGQEEEEEDEDAV